MEGVLQVRVDYDGPLLHKIVGTHDVTATVKRITQGNVVPSCFIVVFQIDDTNECTLPAGHPMRHKCRRSANCINTIGSYECECPSRHFSPADTENGLCAHMTTTATCCGVVTPCKRKQCIEECKANFECISNRCPGDCDPNARCEENAHGYTCSCPAGMLGNGRKCASPSPTIWATPNLTVLTEGYENFCGCQKPRIDYCHGVDCGLHASCQLKPNGHQCVCDPGFTWHSEHGCVDETPPKLRLRCDNPMVLTQCSVYHECGVEIVDENAEEYTRRLQIEYSRPVGGCLRTLEPIIVNYTIETKWTDPPFVRQTRKVNVIDVDECKLAASDVPPVCEDCLPKCVPEARCINTVGSYACSCPPCTKGDGFYPSTFAPGTTPPGFQGGTGCVDSCPPSLTLLGDNPKIFPVCACAGLLCHDPDHNYTAVASDFEPELKMLIEKSRGQILCPDSTR
jgi:hypothetical protein